jgi:hypothetical protein
VTPRAILNVNSECVNEVVTELKKSMGEDKDEEDEWKKLIFAWVTSGVYAPNNKPVNAALVHSNIGLFFPPEDKDTIISVIDGECPTGYNE